MHLLETERILSLLIPQVALLALLVFHVTQEHYFQQMLFHVHLVSFVQAERNKLVLAVLLHLVPAQHELV